MQEYQQRIQRGDYDMAIANISSNSPSPYSVLSQFFIEDSKNIIQYNNPTFDLLVQQARESQNATQAITLYQEAEALLIQTGKMIPLFTQVDYYVVNPQIQDVEFYSYGNLAYFVDASRKG